MSTEYRIKEVAFEGPKEPYKGFTVRASYLEKPNHTDALTILVRGLEEDMEVYKAKYFNKHVVYEAIEKERRYQDKKWGTIENNPHSLERWVEIMQQELDEAREERFFEDALAEIIQVVAVGHACLEQHGIVHGYRK